MKFRKVMIGGLSTMFIVVLWPGFAQASQLGDTQVVTTNDADGDRIVDTVDIDDDNDGIPDIEEISGIGEDIDSDRDGVPDRLDLDSDNDGILDWKESGAVISVDFSAIRVVSGRILGEVSANGFVDDLETSTDNGQMRYSLVNSDWPADELPDVLDLDSDNDGLTDLREAGVDASYDADNDARIDIDSESTGVGNDGIADRLQMTPDKTCCDANGDGVEDTVPRNSDNGDLPDFQDLDSDNDGLSDLIEAGGRDVDEDGRVDNFFDSPVLDGMDDAILLIPFEPSDSNGNTVPDFIDEFVQSGEVSVPEPEQPVQPVKPVDVEPMPTSDIELPVIDEPASDAPLLTDEEPVLEADSDTTADTTVIRDPADRPGSNILSGTDSQPAEDDPSGGVVNTGLNGSGCSVQSGGIDLIVLLLSVFSVALLGRRYTIRRVQA